MDKLIHAHIYKPHNSIFKGSGKDKASCYSIKCSGYNNCGLYKRNECSWIAPFGWQRCPYGSHCGKEEGYTKKARSYMGWINKKEELFEGVLDKLSSHSNILTTIGDYVFLPYSHITMNENIPFKQRSGFMSSGNCFLDKKEFTISNIINICEFRPHAMMGGEIKSYQKEVIPKFLKHLSEQMPDVFKKLYGEYPRTKEINMTNVGRKAYLNTLNVNIGNFVDCHKSEWVWDGEYLTSENSSASFMLINSFTELKLKPKDGCMVTVTDDKQCNEKTVFYKS